jgi:uncharacterized protein YbaR (Trm112 family)
MESPEPKICRIKSVSHGPRSRAFPCKPEVSRECDFFRELVYGVAVLSKELLDILVCPACHQELAYDQSRQTLKCSGCRRIYPIQDDIPILLVERAKIED